ncbi:hypothetical protein CHU98_g4394 [Xylaria longipes]|nr:hypothetical protein CHU98_g4394 [Xylaria longipes]
MTSLVTELLVNPVLRQARRFSFSRPSLASDPPEPDSPRRIAQICPHPQQDDLISETEKDYSLRTDSEDSASSRRSSRSSVVTNPHLDVNTVLSTNPETSAVNARVSGSRSDPSPTNPPSMSTHEPSSPSTRNHTPLPENDGMDLLRKRIFAIQAQEIDHSEKAHLMHQLLQEGYTNSHTRVQPEQPLSPSSPRSPEKRVSQSHGPLESFKFWQSVLGEAENADEFALTDKDLEPTFVPRKQPAESTTDAEDIEPNDEKLLGCEHYRRNVKLQCSTCHRWYTCRFCHDHVEDHILIRKETRNMLLIAVFAELAMELGKTFTIASIHRDCLDEHQKTSYKCPICNKSLLNMESQFRNLDLSIQAQPMPPEFKDTRAIVLCHDCSAKSSTMYHWLGLKCGVCQSYNTAQLQIIGLDAEAIENDLVGRSVQVSDLATLGNPDAVMMDGTTRGMRRRHSSTLTGSAFAGADLSSFPPDRLARSVSPGPMPGRSLHASMVGGYFDLEEEEEDDGDILFGFWRRFPRSLASNDEAEDEDDAVESSDDVTSDEEMGDDEGEESEDDDFELLGHR